MALLEFELEQSLATNNQSNGSANFGNQDAVMTEDEPLVTSRFKNTTMLNPLSKTQEIVHL